MWGDVDKYMQSHITTTGALSYSPHGDGAVPGVPGGGIGFMESRGSAGPATLHHLDAVAASYSVDDEFEFGLDLVLDALAGIRSGS
jgi:hypothetical protein